jgi:acetate kinase
MTATNDRLLARHKIPKDAHAAARAVVTRIRRFARNHPDQIEELEGLLFTCGVPNVRELLLGQVYDTADFYGIVH